MATTPTTPVTAAAPAVSAAVAPAAPIGRLATWRYVLNTANLACS